MCAKLKSAEINSQGGIHNIPSTRGVVISKLISRIFSKYELIFRIVYQEVLKYDLNIKSTKLSGF